MADTGKRMVIARRCAQTLSALVLIYILWNTHYPLSGYINPKFYFLIDPFAMMITSIAERVILPGLLYASGFILLTFILGRFFCGWICPLGALLDLFSFMVARIKKLFRGKYREGEPHPLRRTKYGVLGAVFIFALAGIQLAWTLDPITIFVRAFSFNAHPFIDGAINAGFIRVMEATEYPEWLESLYNFLREGFLSLSTPYFPHTGAILGTLVAILALCMVKRRFWCRYLCPLGATLALPARFSPFRRNADECTVLCGSCRHICRMNAIREDNSYLPEECILCMDCMADCPRSKSTFSFKRPVFRGAEQPREGQSTFYTDNYLSHQGSGEYFTDNYLPQIGSEQHSGDRCNRRTDNYRCQPAKDPISRGQSTIRGVRVTSLPITICHTRGQSNLQAARNPIPLTMTRETFIISALGTLAPLGALASTLPAGAAAPRSGTASRLRPPGALPEDEFIQRCIRCGACMKVCPTNVLQPSPAGARPGAAWVPTLDTRRGYCEYPCNLCGQVCPTEAIRKLTVGEKQKEKIGIAVFNKKICLPYAKGENCIVCEEHCPVKGKAIRIRTATIKGKRVRQPYVVADLCIGCAICELKCPTAPDKGVIVVKVRNA